MLLRARARGGHALAPIARTDHRRNGMRPRVPELSGRPAPVRREADLRRRRDLDGRASHATRGTVHQYRFTGLQAAATDQPEMHGEVIHRQRSRRSVRQPVGDRKDPRLLANGDLGKGAAARKRGDPVTGPDRRAVRSGTNDTCQLGAGCEWQRRFHLVLAARHQQIREGHAGGVYVDEDRRC